MCKIDHEDNIPSILSKHDKDTYEYVSNYEFQTINL